MKQNLQAFTQKEMTRKEFLTVIGFGVLSLLGLSSLMKMLTGHSFATVKNQNLGYGSSVYGGGKDR